MSVVRHETGPRMSQVVIHGNTVYLAGVVARNASGKSMTEQTQDVLKSIDGYLAAGRHRQVEAPVGQYLDHRHGEVRRDERRVGRLGVARQHARARDRRGEARRARLSRRDHGGGGEVAPPTGEVRRVTRVGGSRQQPRARPSRRRSPRPAITSRSWWWRRSRLVREDCGQHRGETESRLGKLLGRDLLRPSLICGLERHRPLTLSPVVQLPGDRSPEAPRRAKRHAFGIPISLPRSPVSLSIFQFAGGAIGEHSRETGFIAGIARGMHRASDGDCIPVDVETRGRSDRRKSRRRT